VRGGMAKRIRNHQPAAPGGVRKRPRLGVAFANGRRSNRVCPPWAESHGEVLLFGYETREARRGVKVVVSGESKKRASSQQDGRWGPEGEKRMLWETGDDLKEE